MTTADTAYRPSYLIYCHDHDAAVTLYAEGAEAYEWGYTAAQADQAAGLAEMTDAEHAAQWGATSPYAEGYRDAYADRCDHSGETCERTRSGLLLDFPQGQTDLLCADCGATLAEDIIPAINR